MSHQQISKGNNFLTCENYISLNGLDQLDNYLEIANKLKISVIVLDDTSIKERKSLLESDVSKKFTFISPTSVYDLFKSEEGDSEKVNKKIRNFLNTDQELKFILTTRKTICGDSIDKIKKQLSSIRNQYDIISLFSKNKNTLKWAAQDGRLDYITVEILDNSEYIDQSLCSVVKQNNKRFEIVLSSLINAPDDRAISEVLRKGKKLMKIINSANTPFIFTMKAKSPLELRSGSQMRLLGSLLDCSYNKTKNSVFEKQLEVIFNNAAKLHESYIVKGIREG